MSTVACDWQPESKKIQLVHLTQVPDMQQKLKRKIEAIIIIRSEAVVWSTNLQVTLPYQSKYE